MTAFEDFVASELPLRSSHLTNAQVSYDGNPNSGSAPAALQGAPAGTWFLEETAELWWRKKNATATSWVLMGTTAAISPANTGEVYVIPSVGSDTTGDGTIYAPFATLTRAVTEAAAVCGGDSNKFVEIFVEKGVYVENVVLEDTNLTNIAFTPLAGATYIFVVGQLISKADNGNLRNVRIGRPLIDEDVVVLNQDLGFIFTNGMDIEHDGTSGRGFYMFSGIGFQGTNAALACQAITFNNSAITGGGASFTATNVPSVRFTGPGAEFTVPTSFIGDSTKTAIGTPTCTCIVQRFAELADSSATVVGSGESQITLRKQGRLSGDCVIGTGAELVLEDGLCLLGATSTPGLTAASGSIVTFDAGGAVAPYSHLWSTSGTYDDAEFTHGHIRTSADVNVGNDLTVDQNIVATNGDITASAGDIIGGQVVGNQPNRIFVSSTTQEIDFTNARMIVMDIGNTVVGNIQVTFTGGQKGGVYYLLVIQGTSPFNDVEWQNAYFPNNGTPPVITTKNNGEDWFQIIVNDTGRYYVTTLGQDYALVTYP